MDEFSGNIMLRIFRKSVEMIQASLKSEKNIGYIPWRRMYIYDNISRSS